MWLESGVGVLGVEDPDAGEVMASVDRLKQLVWIGSPLPHDPASVTKVRIEHSK